MWLVILSWEVHITHFLEHITPLFVALRQVDELGTCACGGARAYDAHCTVAASIHYKNSSQYALREVRKSCTIL